MILVLMVVGRQAPRVVGAVHRRIAGVEPDLAQARRHIVRPIPIDAIRMLGQMPIAQELEQ